MKLIKDAERIPTSEREGAIRVMNKLRAGNRVFGNPAEGLKETLKNLESQISNIEASRSKLQYLDDTGDIQDEIRLLKAGIKGEEELAEYLQLVVKYAPDLEDIVFFASLSDPEQNSIGEEKGYIADSDFVAVHGNHVLILDAKNIRTSPEVPIYLDGNTLVGVGGKEIMEFHPSVHIWNRIFSKVGVADVVKSVHGCVVIVNKSGCLVWKNRDWKNSEVKPLHISDLADFLRDWVASHDSSDANLSLLSAIASMQIRKEESALGNMADVRRRFRI